jgi:LacI family transcriptional regulator
MQEVADALGVHRSTVSLALRNHPSIPEATRVRVRETAERLGYRRHPLVAALMTFRRSARPAPAHTTLACVSSSQPPDAWKESPTMREMLAGARARAQTLGFRIEEFPLFQRGMTPERFHQVLTARGIVGVIVAPLRHGGDSLALEWDQFAAVAVGFSLRAPAIPRIGNDHGQSARLAIAECHRRGYQRIGLVLDRVQMSRVEEQWLSGFLTEHAYPVSQRHPPPLILDHIAEKPLLDWIARHQPDLILTGGSVNSLPVLAILKQAGIKVPGDIGVVSLDLHVRDGSIAGIDQAQAEIGATVVDHLVGQLYRNERGPRAAAVRLHVMGAWQEGRTIRPMA